MAISGLHVTLIAMLASALLQFVWRRLPRAPLYLPAQKAGALAGLLAAAAYVALAGFGVPAQRTLYMLAVVALSIVIGRGRDAQRSLCFALLLVLVIDPWAVLAAGFWLSFGAVGALMLASSGRFVRDGRILAWLRTQWAVTLISLPLLLGLFGQFSLVSPLANVLAIPVVSILITPLVLLFVFVPLEGIAQLADWLLQGLLYFLELLAALPGAVWQQATPPGYLIVLTLVAGLWALLPRGVPGRWVSLLSMLALLTWAPPRPRPGEMSVTVVDVGQGLAVHVQTTGRDMLFDSGPRYDRGSDSGERIIVPYLRGRGIEHLDGVVISHGDMDHAGGAAFIFDTLPVTWWASSLAEDHPLRAHSIRHIACARGQRWVWDDVLFEFLHPPAGTLAGKSNNQSCVLLIRSQQGSVLLPGDIEAVTEREILSAFGTDQMRADMLVAPHHGSRTSSHRAFVQAVAPRVVVFPVGYHNRFRHPARTVVSRYEALGTVPLRSDDDGAVQVEFRAKGLQLTRWRHERARYWHGR